MELQQRAYPIVAEAGQEPEFPQRPGPVEQASIEPGGGIEKLELTTRRIDRGLEDVVPDIEAIVIHPQRATAKRAREVNAPTQLRQARQAAREPAPDLIQTKLAGLIEQQTAVEDYHGAKVEGRLQLLEP